MIFLMRHGEDDDSRLGGWSDASLCQNGIEQVKKSCERLKDSKYNIEYIFSSDLQRAKETADIVSEYLAIPVTHLKEFRETNNGDLAGIPKERFQKELDAGKEQSKNAKKVKAEQKELQQKKKDIRAEIKALEAQLKALGLKAKEIKEIKENAEND